MDRFIMHLIVVVRLRELLSLNNGQRQENVEIMELAKILRRGVSSVANHKTENLHKFTIFSHILSKDFFKNNRSASVRLTLVCKYSIYYFHHLISLYYNISFQKIYSTIFSH